MRASLFIAALVSLCLGAAGLASATPSNAGVARLTVAGAEPFDMLVWYPTPVEAAPWQAGPFIVRAGRDAPIAPGRFPVVLLSHGGGRTGGSPMLLGQLSARLAREGFIVIAPFHGRTRFVQRTHQMVRSFEAAQSDSAWGPTSQPIAWRLWVSPGWRGRAGSGRGNPGLRAARHLLCGPS